MADKTARIELPGKEPVELPILSGTEGLDVVDVRTLGSHGYFTFDPGFLATASCHSKITYIDGNQGILLHRGYPIDQLAEHSNYLEVCYILLYGQAPNKQEFAQFKSKIVDYAMVHEQVSRFFQGFQCDAHPMAMMCGAVGALSAFYPQASNVSDPQHREEAAIHLGAKISPLAARGYQHSIGQPFMYPKNHMSYAENFLHMMFGTP